MAMNVRLLCPVAAVMLAASAGAALAAPFVTAVQTRTANFPSLSAAGSTLIFGGFDSALGTLTGVNLTLSSVTTLNNTVFNSGGTASVGSPTPLTATATTSVTGPSGLAATATLSTPGYVGLVLNGMQTVGTISATATGAQQLLSPPNNLASYVGGASSVSLSLSESGTQGGSVPGTVFTGNNGVADVTVTLSYSYTTPVGLPEPLSIGLLGMGIAVLGVARKQRR